MQWIMHSEEWYCLVKSGSQKKKKTVVLAQYTKIVYCYYKKQTETRHSSNRTQILSICLLTELICTVICVSHTATKKTILFVLL